MKQRLREIIISVTNRCNLRCAMCHIPLSPAPEMSSGEIKELILDAASLHPKRVVFSGGEPLLRSDIFELLKFVQQQRINACLTSNGMLIDDAVAEKLVDCGVGVVNISIEGPAHVHDSLRGRGSFAKATRALECLVRHKVEVSIATIVCRQNFNTLPYVMDLAHTYGITMVKFQPFSRIFLSEKEDGRKFFLPATAVRFVLKSIEETVRRAETYKISTNPVSYLYQIPACICGLPLDHAGTNCAAVWSSCSISSEGDIYLCWVLTDKVIGNTRKDRLSSVWGSAQHNRLRQALTTQGCRGCLMSCYDYNFSKFDLAEFIATTARKLKKTKFYNRQYVRGRLYIKYLSGKISKRLAGLITYRKKDLAEKQKHAIEEIRIAKCILKEKLDSPT